MKKERVIVFIDGFNLYHAVKNNFSHRYKWCNLKKLAKLFLDSEKSQINQVYFFTAYCTWNKAKKDRHKNYIKALKDYCGVYSIFGNYRKTKRAFRKSMPILKIVPSFLSKFIKELRYETFEEKETDVNMALKILEHGFLDDYDHAIILSGDSDLVGAIKMVKKHFPDKKFTSLLPVKSKGRIIQKACDKRFQITSKHFEEALLPEEIVLKTGEKITMPERYKESLNSDEK